MKDNELYTFFKERSGSFNEVPGDVLWAKIENGLNNNPKPSKTIRPPLLFIIGGLILFCGITAYLFITKPYVDPYKIEKQVEIPAETHTIVSHEEVILDPTPTTDTVKRKKALKVLSTEPKKEVTFNNPFEQTTVLDKMQHLSDSLVETEFKTDNFPGKTVVTAKGNISPELFKRIIELTLERNKTAYGKIVVVKAYGHKTFRKVIEIPESERDSTYIPFMPSQSTLTPKMPAKDSLKTEYIQFKESMPKVKLKNDKIINPQPIYRAIVVIDSLKTQQNKPILQNTPPGTNK